MSALDGIRVLDFSVGVAGPLVGMLFGDYGADVIKVECVEGDPGRSSPGFVVLNRNKRSVVVDRQNAESVDWLAASVRGADVCILGHEASLADWGNAVAAAEMKNAELITLRLPAYIDGYTPWIGGESNGLLSAMMGQAARQSSVSGGPIESMSPHMLYAQGVWAATCAFAALVERTVSGLGQVVTVTGVQGVMEAMVTNLSNDPTAPDLRTDVGPAGRHPTYRQIRCAGDRWIAVGALGPKFEERLLRALNLSEILEDPRISGVTARMALPENFDWCCKIINRAFAEREVSALVALLRDIGIPCGPVNSREEWFGSEQIRAIGMRVDLDDPVRGPTVMPGIPVVLTGTPGAIRTPAPQLGEHNGAPPWTEKPTAEPGAPRYVSGPLSGFRALNLGTFVAIPYSGMLLSELGMDVIKVEPISGDPFRVSGYPVNRGMRSLAIDLTTAAGVSAFHELVGVADVVVDGMRPGVTTKLGIDYDALTSVKPDIITQSLSGYGAFGPLSSQPGVDMVIQAESGMMSSWGGDSIPVGNTIAINDTITSGLTAMSVALALFHRQRTGLGQRCWESLAGTSVFLQMEHMVRYPGRVAPAIGRQDLRGLTPSRSYYATSDGWVYVDIPDWNEAARERLASAGLVEGNDLAEGLAAALGRLSSMEAITRLTQAAVPVARARKLSEVLKDPRLLDAEVFHIREAEGGGSFFMTGRYAGFSRTQRRGPMSPPGLGEHTREVLTEAGLPGALIDGLRDSRAIFEGGPVAHLVPIIYR